MNRNLPNARQALFELFVQAARRQMPGWGQAQQEFNFTGAAA